MNNCEELEGSAVVIRTESSSFTAEFFKKFILIWFILISPYAHAACEGRFINPITDINWKSMFPLTIAGVKVSLGPLPDTTGGGGLPICFCPITVPPFIRVGVPTGFWEPTRLAEVVRTPMCFPSLGGASFSVGGITMPNGSRSIKSDSGKASFYNVHWMLNPMLAILNVIANAGCLTKGSFDVLYITEFDPMWSDDELSMIINPEAVLFGNSVAQAACAADCVAATAGLPLDPLFWCAGCQGSLYPFSGTVSDHVGGVMASILLTERFMAKMHREGLAVNSSDPASQCIPFPALIIKKSQYRIQMVRPIRQTVIPALPFGRTDTIISSGKEFPIKGEDFVYQIWRKRQCCAF